MLENAKTVWITELNKVISGESQRISVDHCSKAYRQELQEYSSIPHRKRDSTVDDGESHQWDPEYLRQCKIPDFPFPYSDLTMNPGNRQIAIFRFRKLLKVDPIRI